MSRIAEKINKPYLIVVISILLSVTLYTVIASIFDVGNKLIGFSLAVIVPLIVSMPIAVILVGYIQKINKQKQELANLDVINKKLFSLVSHDIRSPIAALKSMVELTLSDDLDKDQQKKYLGELSNRIDTLLLFLEGLLKWSQDQIQNKSIEAKLFSAHDTILMIRQLYEELLKEKNITLVLGDLNQYVFADKEYYSFVVRNIIHNAIKFTPTNGEIHISVDVKTNETHTIIKDSGIGLSKTEIDNIQDREKWFTKNGTANEKGTGFGLNTCIAYLEKNNGRLEIESEPGQGTQMTIILPNK